MPNSPLFPVKSPAPGMRITTNSTTTNQSIPISSPTPSGTNKDKDNKGQNLNNANGSVPAKYLSHLVWLPEGPRLKHDIEDGNVKGVNQDSDDRQDSDTELSQQQIQQQNMKLLHQRKYGRIENIGNSNSYHPLALTESLKFISHRLHILDSIDDDIKILWRPDFPQADRLQINHVRTLLIPQLRELIDSQENSFEEILEMNHPRTLLDPVLDKADDHLNHETLINQFLEAIACFLPLEKDEDNLNEPFIKRSEMAKFEEEQKALESNSTVTATTGTERKSQSTSSPTTKATASQQAQRTSVQKDPDVSTDSESNVTSEEVFSPQTRHDKMKKLVNFNQSLQYRLLTYWRAMRQPDTALRLCKVCSMMHEIDNVEIIDALLSCSRSSYAWLALGKSKIFSCLGLRIASEVLLDRETAKPSLDRAIGYFVSRHIVYCGSRKTMNARTEQSLIPIDVLKQLVQSLFLVLAYRIKETISLKTMQQNSSDENNNAEGSDTVDDADTRRAARSRKKQEDQNLNIVTICGIAIFLLFRQSTYEDERDLQSVGDVVYTKKFDVPDRRQAILGNLLNQIGAKPGDKNDNNDNNLNQSLSPLAASGSNLLGAPSGSVTAVKASPKMKTKAPGISAANSPAIRGKQPGFNSASPKAKQIGKGVGKGGGKTGSMMDGKLGRDSSYSGGDLNGNGQEAFVDDINNYMTEIFTRSRETRIRACAKIVSEMHMTHILVPNLTLSPSIPLVLSGILEGCHQDIRTHALSLGLLDRIIDSFKSDQHRPFLISSLIRLVASLMLHDKTKLLWRSNVQFKKSISNLIFDAIRKYSRSFRSIAIFGLIALSVLHENDIQCFDASFHCMEYYTDDRQIQICAWTCLLNSGDYIINHKEIIGPTKQDKTMKNEEFHRNTLALDVTKMGLMYPPGNESEDVLNRYYMGSENMNITNQILSQTQQTTLAMNQTNLDIQNQNNDYNNTMSRTNLSPLPLNNSTINTVNNYDGYATNLQTIKSHPAPTTNDPNSPDKQPLFPTLNVSSPSNKGKLQQRIIYMGKSIVKWLSKDDPFYIAEEVEESRLKIKQYEREGDMPNAIAEHQLCHKLQVKLQELRNQQWNQEGANNGLQGRSNGKNGKDGKSHVKKNLSVKDEYTDRLVEVYVSYGGINQAKAKKQVAELLKKSINTSSPQKGGPGGANTSSNKNNSNSSSTNLSDQYHNIYLALCKKLKVPTNKQEGKYESKDDKSKSGTNDPSLVCQGPLDHTTYVTKKRSVRWEYRKRLTELYMRQNHYLKARNVDSELLEWRGNEHQLYQKRCRDFGEHPLPVYVTEFEVEEDPAIPLLIDDPELQYLGLTTLSFLVTEENRHLISVELRRIAERGLNHPFPLIDLGSRQLLSVLTEAQSRRDREAAYAQHEIDLVHFQKCTLKVIVEFGGGPNGPRQTKQPLSLAQKEEYVSSLFQNCEVGGARGIFEKQCKIYNADPEDFENDESSEEEEDDEDDEEAEEGEEDGEEGKGGEGEGSPDGSGGESPSSPGGGDDDSPVSPPVDN